MRSLRVLFAGMMLCAAVPPLVAQTAEPPSLRDLQVGERVRVSYSRTLEITGELLEPPGEGLLVRRGGSPLTWDIPLADVERLAVARGRPSRGRGAARGALTGLAIGGVAGVVAGAVICHGETEDICAADATTVGVVGAASFGVVGAASFGVVSAAIGAAIGAIVRPGRAWVDVRLPQRSGRTSP